MDKQTLPYMNFPKGSIFDVKIVKEGWAEDEVIYSVTDIVQLPSGTIRISGSSKCECCGQYRDEIYDIQKTDTVIMMPKTNWEV